jgi:dTDP-4-amino-4,6-dideoxygalactose transaminase
MPTSDQPTIDNYLPVTGEDEVEFAKQALTTGWVSYGGPFVAEFERQVAARSGFSGAVAVSSGTCALQLAFELLAAPDTEVFMPALTFVAPASVAVRASMHPVFVDLDERTWQMCLRTARAFLNRCRRTANGLVNPASGRVVSTLCIVHLWGALADLKETFEIAAEFQLNLVQDAAQCLGATYLGRPFGAFDPYPGEVRCIATTSFNANKIITTGAGGALLTNDAASLVKGRHIASTAKADGFAFLHDGFGVNYRMSNVNAGIGVAQLRRVDSFIAAKVSIDSYYRAALGAVAGVRFPEAHEGVKGNHWAHVVSLPESSERIVRALQQKGVQARPVWIPLRDLPIYSKFHTVSGDRTAESLWRSGIMLPASPSLSHDELCLIVRSLKEVL